MFGNNKHHRRRFHPLKIVFFAIVFIAFALAMGWVVMFLWNFILPDTIGVKPLTYWKALGLLVLTRILFGGFRGRPSPWGGDRKRKWRKKWMNMSDEERQQFKSKWKSHYRKRWNTDEEDSKEKNKEQPPSDESEEV